MQNTPPLPESLVFSDCSFCHEPCQGVPIKRRGVSGSHHYRRRCLASVLRLVACRRAWGRHVRSRSREQGAVNEVASGSSAPCRSAGSDGVLALQPESAGSSIRRGRGAGWSDARADRTQLICPTRRAAILALQYRSYPTEFMGCMIGETRAAPSWYGASRRPTSSPSIHSHAGRPSPDVRGRRGSGTVGMIHSHPGGERCWYYSRHESPVGRPVVRGPALSGGCNHVRRPRVWIKPRHGGGATTAGGR